MLLLRVTYKVLSHSVSEVKEQDTFLPLIVTWHKA